MTLNNFSPIGLYVFFAWARTELASHKRTAVLARNVEEARAVFSMIYAPEFPFDSVRAAPRFEADGSRETVLSEPDPKSSALIAYRRFLLRSLPADERPRRARRDQFGRSVVAGA